MEQLQIFEMVAEIDEKNSSHDDNDELNENEKQKNNKQEKSKKISGRNQNTLKRI
jgi:hypothetical protein